MHILRKCILPFWNLCYYLWNDIKIIYECSVQKHSSRNTFNSPLAESIGVDHGWIHPRSGAGVMMMVVMIHVLLLQLL